MKFRHRNGWSFERLNDGAVQIEVEVRDITGHIKETRIAEIAPRDWASIVAGVSANGKINKQKIEEIHG